jgi:hypothetical protein
VTSAEAPNQARRADRRWLLPLLLAAAAAAVLLVAAESASAQPPVKFVAGSLGGRIAYSYDGITWTQATNNPGGGAAVWAVGFNGTAWVAAAGDGTAWTSPDGITWTDHTLPAVPSAPGPVFNTWGGVTWDGTKWVLAGGSQLIPRILTSTDGATWVLESTGSVTPTEPRHLLGTTWNGNMWLSNGRRGFFTSADGHSWTFRGDGGLATTVPADTDFNVRAQIWCNGRWHAASTVSGALTSSPDGVTWTLGPTVGQITKFATDGTTTVAVGLDGARVWTTTDFTTWTPRTAHPFPSNSVYALTYGDGVFVAGTWLTNRVAYSTDGGATWTTGTYPSGMTVLGLASREQHQDRVCKVARPDAFVLNEDQPAQPLDVLANDRTSTAPLTITGNTTPAKGRLTGPVGGVFTYTPYQDATGADTFTYTLQDSVGQVSSATVSVTLNAVNDVPLAQVARALVPAKPDGGAQVVPGVLRDVRPARATALDEAGQGITFAYDSSTNPGLFSGLPALERSGSATATTAQVPPTTGDYALLRFTLSGATGSSYACFRAVDTGGTAVATNQWGATATGVDRSAPLCLTVVVNGPPVAYFEASPPSARPGQRVAFDPCPATPPRCSVDQDGALTMFLWEFGDGQTSSLANPMHAYDRPGTYQARLTVWDEHGASGTYEQTVRIDWGDTPPAQEDYQGEGGSGAPVADAGGDRTVLEGDQVALSGTCPGCGGDAVFLWTQVAGPTVKVRDAATATPSFTAPALPTMDPVDLAFELRVSQGAATSAPDTVVVRVVSANRLPVADAGGMAEGLAGSPVRLDGSASRDPEGAPLTYRWEQVLAPGEAPVALANATAPTLSFTPAQAGTYRFVLKVSDGKATSEDSVTVLVRDPARPAPALDARPPLPTDPQRAAQARAMDVVPLLLAGLLLLVLGGGVVAFMVWRMRRAE